MDNINVTPNKKLIEVSLPLEIINDACLKESSVPRRGHTSTLHPWWAKRPLAACAAVIFSSIVDDPGNKLNKKEAERERKRLFNIIEQLVKWENRQDTKILEIARKEVEKYIDKGEITLIDPFSGRGNIALEAQRLGLQVCASDYNPISTMICKAVVEIPPKYLGKPPINPNAKKSKLDGKWNGCKGLAEDVKYYGEWIQNKAEIKLKKLFEIPELKRKPCVYIWVRTIKCPNPACGCDMPLTASFWLSKRKNRLCWIKPIIKENKIHSYQIMHGEGTVPKATVSRAGATCICCGSTIPFDYIRTQGMDQKINYKLIVTIENTKQGRKYRLSDEKEEEIAKNVDTESIVHGEIPQKALGFRIQKYGINNFSQLFTKRQFVVLITYSDLIKEVGEKIISDSGGDIEYSIAVKTYLSFALDKLAAWNSTLCSWIPSIEGIKWTFPRQTLNMSWDFTEINPLEKAPGNWFNHVEWVSEFLNQYPEKMPQGIAKQLDATQTIYEANNIICSTDPPYYDNIGYANLSDFFYIWLRRTLKEDYPEIFSTLMSPKNNELIADPGRFEGNKKEAEDHFEKGMVSFFKLIREKINPEYPLTVYYAFKQEEQFNEMGQSNRSSTGWEKMLEGLLQSGFMITGTWPMRTERAARQRSHLSNALASSIIIVCRLKPENISLTTRREFISTLKNELPLSLKNLQNAGIAPVDLAQSVIGPGMAIFSRYSKILEADGTPMSIKTALQIINQQLDTYLTEQESDMDNVTRFCISWYDQYGWAEGPFGDANILATAKGTAVNALEKTGVVFAKAGKVRLFNQDDLNEKWDPATKRRLTVWECVHHMIRALEHDGEDGAAKILRKIGGLSESVKELSYRLYSLSEKHGWGEDALIYNSLISSWQTITDKAQFGDKISKEDKKRLKDKSQKTLFEDKGV